MLADWVCNNDTKSARSFIKDLEALVKWTSEFQNPLVHKPVYSSTTFILVLNTFMNNLIVYLHQLISTVKFEIFNDFKIMPSEVRLKNLPQECGPVCVDR